MKYHLDLVNDSVEILEALYMKEEELIFQMGSYLIAKSGEVAGREKSNLRGA